MEPLKVDGNNARHEASTCRCCDVLSRLWAKDPHHMAAGRQPYAPTPHLLDTAAVIEALWHHWLRPGLRDILVSAIAPGDVDATVRSLMLLAGLHDVGKVNPLFQFQPYSPSAGPWRERHVESMAQAALQPMSATLVGRANVWKDNALPGHGMSVARRHEYIGAYGLLSEHLTDESCVRDNWLPISLAGHHGLWRSPESPYEVPRNDYELVDEVLAGGWQSTLDAQRELIERTLGLQLADVAPLSDHSGPAFILASGLLMLADWLASSDDLVAEGKALIADGLDPATEPGRWLETRQAAMVVHLERTLGILKPADATDLILGGYVPRPLQQAAIDLGPADGLWLVAFPTGEGKTKAAQLRHAQRPGEQLLFGLPTTATTDAMTETLRRDFHQDGTAVTKSHQFASFSQTDGVAERDAHLYADFWFDSSTRRLFAPVAVGTCDQILAAALTQKNAQMRLLAIANHHVVLDEVHTFDAYQRTLLAEVLAWLGATGTRTTLLSASIPAVDAVAYRNAYARGAKRDKKQRVNLPYEGAYPSHSLLAPGPIDAEDPQSESDMEVDWSDAEVALSHAVEPVAFRIVEMTDAPSARSAWALGRVATYPRCHVAVVCSTVDGAIDTARLVGPGLPETHDLIVLHSRMTRAQRTAIENRLRRTLGPPPSPPAPPNTPDDSALAAFEDAMAVYADLLAAYVAIRPVVVVATQIIEASLDLDFDIMGSDLAPSPSLVQRAGRLWRFRDDSHRRRRHGHRGPRREMTVFVPLTADRDLSARGCMPYSMAELRKVLDLIRATPVLQVPEGVQAFVDGGRVAEADLNSDDETAADVSRHIGGEMVKRAAAGVSKANLLSSIIAPKGITYPALKNLTKMPDDDFAMRTRFVDLPSFSFILFDSRMDPTVPENAERADGVIPGALPAWAASASASALASRVARWQQAVMPANGRHAEDLLVLHEMTLNAAGAEEWAPRSDILQRQYPVDLALRDGLAQQVARGGRAKPVGRFSSRFGWA